MTLFTFGDENKAIRHFELAQKRLAEAEELAAQNKFDKAKPVWGRYNRELEKTKYFLERAQLKGKDMTKLAERILEIMTITNRRAKSSKNSPENFSQKAIRGNNSSSAGYQSISRQR